jgi:hypothetical protein
MEWTTRSKKYSTYVQGNLSTDDNETLKYVENKPFVVENITFTLLYFTLKYVENKSFVVENITFSLLYFKICRK